MQSTEAFKKTESIAKKKKKATPWFVFFWGGGPGMKLGGENEEPKHLAQVGLTWLIVGIKVRAEKLTPNRQV